MYKRTLNNEIRLASTERFSALGMYSTNAVGLNTWNTFDPRILLDIIDLVKQIDRVDKLYKNSGQSLFMNAPKQTTFGRKFVDLLARVVQLKRCSGFYRYDPHIEVFWQSIEGRNIAVGFYPSYHGALRSDAWIDPDVVNGIFIEVKRRVMLRDFWHINDMHEREMNRHYQELRDTFSDICANFPHAKIIRLETSFGKDRNNFFPRMDEQLCSLTSGLNTWLGKVCENLGSAVIAYRWKMDPDSPTSFRAHTVFLLIGPTDLEINQIELMMKQEWEGLSGVGSYCINPSAMAQRLEYRGMSAYGQYETPLRDVLQGCAVFMAGTDRIVRLATADRSAYWGYKFDPSGKLHPKTPSVPKQVMKLRGVV